MKVRSIQSHQVLSPKTRVNFEVDARSLPNVDQVELKGSFNPETGLFDPKWNEGKALPMRDDGKGGDQKAGDGIYTAQVDLSGANGSGGELKTDRAATYGRPSTIPKSLSADKKRCAPEWRR